MGGPKVSDNQGCSVFDQVNQWMDQLSKDANSPSVANVLGPVIKTIGEQVGGAQGKEIGSVIDQGLHSAEDMIKNFLGAFSGAGGTPPGHCPNTPQPFSPGQFPKDIFDHPSRYFPKPDPSSGHPSGPKDSISDDPGFNVGKSHQPGTTDSIPSDPGFSPKSKDHKLDDRDSVPNDPGFTVGGKNWPGEAAKSRNGTNWDGIRKAIEDAKRSGDHSKLKSAQKDQDNFIKGCKLIATTIANSAAEAIDIVGRSVGLR